MKRLTTQKEAGVVLLLILAFMTMFAMIVLTFMIVTTNMAETAKYAGEKDVAVGILPDEDSEFAIKTLLIGTNNANCPIGPLGIMENLYGDYRNSTNPFNDLSFRATLQPFTSNTGETFLKIDMPDSFTFWDNLRLIEETGNVLTIGDYDAAVNPNIDPSVWDEFIKGTSVLVYDKVVGATNPSDYQTGDIYFKGVLNEKIGQYFSGNNYASITDVYVRMNRPAFSGTGAGYFSPATNTDGQMGTSFGISTNDTSTGTTSITTYAVPFAYWANASAPDLVPFVRSTDGSFSAQTFWAHLLDGNFDPYEIVEYNGGWRQLNWQDSNGQSYLASIPDPGNPSNGSVYYHRQAKPVGVNAPYTAADTKSLFLARYSVSPTVGGIAAITPSFHRTELFEWFAANVVDKNSATNNQFGEQVDLLSMLRKLTPRPLPMDHWNFDGGNATLPKYGYGTGPTDRATLNAEVVLLANKWAYPIDNGFVPDVDNDNDGIRDGIWIPSGLPIRTDENGTPFATMYSYTVLDLDGRVNVNTAGNWDQTPNLKYSSVNNQGNSKPFSFLRDLENLNNQAGSNVAPGSPFYNVEFLNNRNWLDDNDYRFAQTTDSDGNTTSADRYLTRGFGLGASSVLLYETLKQMKLETANLSPDQIVSNILWRRNTSNVFESSATNFSPDAWIATATRTSLRQPGYQPSYNSENDDIQGSKKVFFRMLRPTYFGDSNEGGNANPELVYFPFRGKTRVVDYGMNWQYFPDFRFTDTALRSYDALGHEISTYSPQYSENPYLTYQNHFSVEDSPFTVLALEKLLRPWDADAATLSADLTNALFKNDPYNEAETPAVNVESLARTRNSLTTLSSDIPAASMVFPIPGADQVVIDNDDGTQTIVDNSQDGVVGITELVRRCVTSEFQKKYGKFIDDQEADNEVEMRNALDGFIDETTVYLVSMLPPEILSGQKIDLNKMTKTSAWNDIVVDANQKMEKYDSSGNLTDDARLVHHYGLAKRMEYARGLYILLMTLTYHDRNAGSLYPKGQYQTVDGEEYSNYIEGGFNLGDVKSDGEKELSDEMIATRIAQWVVNLVDFSDPDATMTPFYFDVNPFDGWWTRLEVQISQTQDSQGNPIKTISDLRYYKTFENNAAKDEFFEAALSKPDAAYSVTFSPAAYPHRDITGNYVDDLWFDTGKDDSDVSFYAQYKEQYSGTYAGLIRRLLLEERSTSGLSTDRDFRVVWGMERPDLVLTETMNFHDLHLANTDEDNGPKKEYEEGSGGGSDGESDATFDQVARPVGSTYLELYCTANPNIPQSPELYDFVDGVWKLRLSKKTPQVEDDTEAEYPVWRVAISDSSDPLDAASGSDKIYRKKENSVLEWIAGKVDDSYKASTFSFQPKQFRNPPISLDTAVTCDADTKSSNKLSEYNMSEVAGYDFAKLNSLGIFTDWNDYNLPASNILGPTKITAAEKADELQKREIELDRIVWFCHTDYKTAADKDKAGGVRKGEWLDAARIFQNQDASSNNVVYLAPNQYLVVGPDVSRPIGSKSKEATASNKYDKYGNKVSQLPNDGYDGGSGGRFGVPSLNRIDLTNLAGKTNDRYQYMVAVSNVGGRGLNISEPLWVSGKDPYIYSKSVQKSGGNTFSFVENQYPDIPFELPKGWASKDAPSEENVKGIPVAEDEIFGLGTIPSYKSAFLQRVADPNRPYHPLLNPYLTVDWNTMDLTVFNGECVQIGAGEQNNKTKFADNSELDENVIEITNKQDAFGDVSKCDWTKNFSSRQFGNSEQKKFGATQKDCRPNPWNRYVKKDSSKDSGLEAPFKFDDLSNYASLSSYKDDEAVVEYRPKHTLGYFNNRGDETTYTENNAQKVWFRNLNDDYKNTGDLYYGTPKKPFEHLVWGDAPLSNPTELTLVPACAPGRFNQEFVRLPEKEKIDLKELYLETNEQLGSLGTGGIDSGESKEKLYYGIFGTLAYDRDSKPLGPYFNFFHSSATTGKSLNLCKLFDFVYVSSLYPDAYELTSFDAIVVGRHGETVTTYDPVFASKMRDPGKINVNTLTEPVWASLAGDVGYADNTNTPWNEIQETDADGNPVTDDDGNVVTNSVGFQSDRVSYLGTLGRYFLPFMPAHTSSLYTNGFYANYDQVKEAPEKFSLIASNNNLTSIGSLFDNVSNSPQRGNMFAATEEMQRLSGLLTNRSNVFAVWITVGYFEVERINPGVNIPAFDPDGNAITLANLNDSNYKYYYYYRAIYPDGYSYGKELGSDFGETTRNRSFYIIDRSVPTDFRRGQSWNYKDSILINRLLD